MSRVSKTTIWVLAAGLCSVVIAAPAQAKSDRVTGGQATVTASAAITKFLRSRGITVSAIGPATVGNGAMTMPMVSGTITVPSMRGVMITKGGLKYTRGTRTLRVHGYILTHLSHGAKLTAVVNGRRIVIAQMLAPKVTMSGKNGTMSGGLRLSTVWAHLINHLVGKHVVHPGEDLGDLSASVKVA